MKRLAPCLIVMLAWIAPAVYSQSAPDIAAQMGKAILKARQDVEVASEELNRLRSSNATALLPLAEKRDALEREVRELRERVRQIRSVALASEREHEAAVRELTRQEDEIRFLADLALEYRRGLETRMNPVEADAEREEWVAQDARLASENNIGEAFGPLIASGIERIQRRIGGQITEATVLDAAGVEIPGKAAVAGPMAYFVSSDGSRSGRIVTRFGESRPALEESSGKNLAGDIAALIRGEESLVRMDVTGGDAAKVEGSRLRLSDHLRKGGIVMIPLLLCAGVAAWLAGLKWLSLRRILVRDDAAMAMLSERLSAGDGNGARQIAERVPEPLRGLFREVLRGRDLPREQLEQNLHEQLLGFTPRLEQYLGTLAVIAGIAPLLGLLGTVTGMIHTFQMVTIFGTGDARLLSGGISEALITTEAGLVIAIPVLLIHALLTRQSKNRLAALEQTAVDLVQETHKGDAR